MDYICHMNRKIFWIVLALAHAMFLVKQVFIHNSLLQDSVEYLFAADNLRNSGTLYAWNLNFASNPDWLTKRPILYPAILLVFKTMSLGSNPLFLFLTYLVQNLLSLNTIRLVFKIADKHLVGFHLGKALMFLLFSLSQLIYANLIMCEIWLQAALFGLLYVWLMLEDSNRKFLYLSLLLIAALALKPVVMPAVYLFPIVVLMTLRKRLRLSFLGLSLLPIAFALSYSWVNQKRTGHFQYSSITTINLLHYNTYVMLMSEYGTIKADSVIDDIKLKTRGMAYSDKQAFIESSCKALIKEHLGTYTYLHARGIVFALIDPGRFDFTQFFNLPHKGNLIYQTNQKGMLGKVVQSFMNPLGMFLLILMAFNIFRFYKVCVFLFSKSHAWLLKLSLIAIPVYILALTGPIGTSRFFMPLIPFAFLIYLFSTNPRKP